ncbi:hypothetical protein BDP55DRAFT_714453 [Colletotrichum godetiae]|uniref:Uncharacterized protein n=1 Tax=Colletotrichum godetiae TaxID=1209918 RepID=A0AAJ0EZ07_9PEZI|nr:uncharacterized protein BDP55DRAFT_714453 [Colletotrichum godetiae]KAK1676735.1 hypothetical protein BDP55DRAFT_714453 [Colletotrichum godetiae]
MQPISGARKIMEQRICRFLGGHRFLSLQGLTLNASAKAGASLDLTTSTSCDTPRKHSPVEVLRGAVQAFFAARGLSGLSAKPSRNQARQVSPTHYHASDTSPGPERPRLGPLFFPAGAEPTDRVRQRAHTTFDCLSRSLVRYFGSLVAASAT